MQFTPWDEPVELTRLDTLDTYQEPIDRRIPAHREDVARCASAQSSSTARRANCCYRS
jgi:hypothetical protein